MVLQWQAAPFLQWLLLFNSLTLALARISTLVTFMSPWWNNFGRITNLPESYLPAFWIQWGGVIRSVCLDPWLCAEQSPGQCSFLTLAMGALVSASLGHTPQFSVSHNRGSSYHSIQLQPQAWRLIISTLSGDTMVSVYYPEDTGRGCWASSIFLPSTIPFTSVLGYRFITHALPSGMRVQVHIGNFLFKVRNMEGRTSKMLPGHVLNLHLLIWPCAF